MITAEIETLDDIEVVEADSVADIMAMEKTLGGVIRRMSRGSAARHRMFRDRLQDELSQAVETGDDMETTRLTQLGLRLSVRGDDGQWSIDNTLTIHQALRLILRRWRRE